MAKIDTVAARSKLLVRREPYWQKLQTGGYIGYRRTDDQGTWVARVQEPGSNLKKYRALGSFDNLTEAERFDAATKAAQVFIDHLACGGNSENITIGDAARNYVKERYSAGKLDSAADLEGRFNRWLYPDTKLANTPLSKLKISHIKSWRDNLVKAPKRLQDPSKKSDKPKSAATVNREIAVMRSILNQALRDGHVPTDIWTNVLRPVKASPVRRNLYLDPEQRRALVNCAAGDLAPLLRLMGSLPLRPGAAASLTVGNFDRRQGTLNITKDKAKAGRAIKLPATTAKFVEELCKNKLPTAPLCARADGSAWNKDSWKIAFRQASIAANLPAEATLYTVRHSTICDLIAIHKLDAMTVSILAGTSIQMIELHYSHLLQDRAVAALAALEAAA